MRAGLGTVRIIGGRWRGRRLPVVDADGLRPSGDRVRETLFNWLQPVLPGARVLDLFAGTGALGLEALSRGAAKAVLVERATAVATTLRAAVQGLGAEDLADVVQADALAWLGAVPSPATPRFDVVFLDPPFATVPWPRLWPALAAWLADDAWLYVESPAQQPASPPPGFALHRQLRTREADAALYRRAAAPGGTATLAGASEQPIGLPSA
jgi:16S rRNA (guanine966-N2)-methyltransferase